IVAAPLTSIRNLPHLVFWLWFHLVHFNTSNQTASKDETSKPDRPLPTGKITLQEALILCWTSMPMCSVLPLTYSKEVMYSSMSRCLAAFEASTTLVAREFVAWIRADSLVHSGNDKSCLDTAGWLTVFLSGSIFTITIYAQGTPPFSLAVPRLISISRWVVGWSTGLSLIWNLDIYCAVVFTALGAYTGSRFMRHTTIKEDRNSYFHYKRLDS
ncbi:hypothetical protein DFH07DRAFT_731320, partial [Mycena maculata]